MKRRDLADTEPVNFNTVCHSAPKSVTVKQFVHASCQPAKPLRSSVRA